MVLDTNILISYLNGDKGVIKIMSGWKLSSRSLFIFSISVAEILALPKLAPGDIVKIKRFLGNFISIPFDDEIAEKVALIKRQYNLGLPDAGIAASSLINDFPLITRDKQFGRVEEILMVEI